MENKVRAIKRPVYFTISLIAFPFCLPCLPPDGTVQNTVYIHTYRHTYVSACFWCTPIYVSIAFDPCTLYTHTHTRVHSIFTSQERCISWKEVSWNCIDWNPCKPLRPSDVYRVIGSLEMRFLAIVRQIRRRLPPWWTGSIMEISRPAEGGMGRILRSMEISLLFPPLRFLEIINTIYSWTNSFFFC